MEAFGELKKSSDLKIALYRIYLHSKFPNYTHFCFFQTPLLHSEDQDMDFSTQIATQLILSEINEKNGNDVLMSPLSINMMLNMVASGSAGETLDQFLKFLGSNGIDELSDMSSEVISLLASNSNRSKPMTTFDYDHSGKKTEEKPPLFSLTNAMWVDHHCQFKSSFKKITETIYKAKVENVDLVKQAEQVRTDVNSWVENETKGLIRNILPEGTQLGPPLCLANALYFKGTWEQAFRPSMTKDRNFHLLDGRTIQAPFVNSHHVYHYYASNDDFKVLKLRYQRGESNRDKQFSMYMFLPHKKCGLQDMVEKFNSHTKLLSLEYVNRHMREVKLSHVSIPKLKFQYDVDAKKLLKQKGLTLPFSAEDADFSNMVDCGDVYIAFMVHKSCIEVNEVGTEAAAATDIGMFYSSPPQINRPPPLPTFVADHPFMFMIVEEFSNLIVFYGAVLHPQK
ncbi:serpin-ZX-like [Humulus lupulus]|uniref:serpin-ZX-like n=1 Tax=Humulus lupulus TaxID=3486 RepID=UPI002B4151D7|nr:serpin-ZX-like [Humulus lupulus]